MFIIRLTSFDYRLRTNCVFSVLSCLRQDIGEDYRVELVVHEEDFDSLEVFEKRLIKFASNEERQKLKIIRCACPHFAHTPLIKGFEISKDAPSITWDDDFFMPKDHCSRWLGAIRKATGEQYPELFAFSACNYVNLTNKGLEKSLGVFFCAKNKLYQELSLNAIGDWVSSMYIPTNFDWKLGTPEERELAVKAQRIADDHWWWAMRNKQKIPAILIPGGYPKRALKTPNNLQLHLTVNNTIRPENDLNVLDRTIGGGLTL